MDGEDNVPVDIRIGWSLKNTMRMEGIGDIHIIEVVVGREWTHKFPFTLT